jgi:hypothetical protein
MSVSSKWYVTKIDGQQVYFSPVCRGIENRQWSSATPGGEMRLYITNPDALAQYELYQEYEFVSEHRPKPAPGDRHPVDHYVDHPASDPSRSLHICATCGSYARLSPDGEPDWTGHYETFGRSVVETGDNELANQ